MSHTLSLSTHDRTIDHTLHVLDRIFPPPRAFAIRLWNGTELQANRTAPFTLILNHPGALRRMFSPPIELSLGEAYIYGDFDVEGDREVNLIAERSGFEVRDVENWREHYALTLRHWLTRLEQNRAKATALTNEVTYRTWRLFLASSIYGFETGNINVNQTLLARPSNGQSGVPLMRADLYV